MQARLSLVLVGWSMLIVTGLLPAQPVQVPAPKADPPPPRDAIAARVNGQAIPELAVYRSLTRVPPERRAEARKEVLNFLIDNTILDQYLLQLKIVVESKEVDEHVQKIKKEAVDTKQDFQALLKDLMVTEDELRTELTSALRWDKFVLQQGTEKVLQEYFKANVAMFNGSETKARHILIKVQDGKSKEAVAQLVKVKQQIEAQVAQTLTKLPANTDAITRERERAKALEAAFAKTAADVSTCPSKKDGGDLGFFPRAGAMVEPFARAAFALKQFQMSDPVATEFGYHLILATDSKPGKEVTFEKAKPFVQEVYGERLREAVLNAYRPKAKIEIVNKK